MLTVVSVANMLVMLLPLDDATIPVPPGGRATALFVMIAGVGLIAVLASLLPSLLTGSPPTPEEEKAPPRAPSSAIEAEMAAIRQELAALRRLLEQTPAAGD